MPHTIQHVFHDYQPGNTRLELYSCLLVVADQVSSLKSKIKCGSLVSYCSLIGSLLKGGQRPFCLFVKYILMSPKCAFHDKHEEVCWMNKVKGFSDLYTRVNKLSPFLQCVLCHGAILVQSMAQVLSPLNPRERSSTELKGDRSF